MNIGEIAKRAKVSAATVSRAIKRIPTVIPRDLSVIGSDIIRITQYMLPPLSTIDMSQTEIARIAFQALLEDVQRETANPKGTEYVLMACLVLRESTALNPNWAGMGQRGAG
jgi:DNA-binding LacI/PurR family transcriptional regulator